MGRELPRLRLSPQPVAEMVQQHRRAAHQVPVRQVPVPRLRVLLHPVRRQALRPPVQVLPQARVLLQERAVVEMLIAIGTDRPIRFATIKIAAGAGKITRAVSAQIPVQTNGATVVSLMTAALHPVVHHQTVRPQVHPALHLRVLQVPPQAAHQVLRAVLQVAISRWCSAMISIHLIQVAGS